MPVQISAYSSKGKIKAKKAGNTTITVCSKLNKKVKATCKITVKKKVVPTKKPTPTKKVTPIRKPTVTITPELLATASPKPTAIEKPTFTADPTLAPGESYGELNSPVVDEEGNVTYSCVYFGNYPQSDATGEKKEPIKWRVLYIQGEDAFLVADQNLDVRAYNDSYRDVTWETCTMRSWLNGYGSELNADGIDYGSDNFIDRAFDEAEKSAIFTTNVVNKDNPEYGTSGGKDTQDKIFLLSIDEVSNGVYGFETYGEDEARKRTSTAYVAEKQNSDVGETYGWWLRSPGCRSNGAADVNYYGCVNEYGDTVFYSRVAVCPALHLNLSSSDVWSVAENVTIGNYGEPTKEPDPTVTSEPTKEPDPTVTSEPTKEPDPTVTSEPTKEPDPTATPEPTKEPDPTVTPEPTKEPDPTATPEPTKEPDPTASPSPTPTPSPTLAPGESYGELNSPVVDEEGNVTYSCVYFGNYPQSDATGETKEPIKWRVLYIQGEDAFLIADQNLDVMQYNKSDRAVTWETCTMRSWLNGYGSELNADRIDYGSDNFIDRAFNDAEKSAILTTNVENKDNPKYGISGGKDTQDKIFLLSIDEVSDGAYGFKPYKDNEQKNIMDEARKRTNTAYAAGKRPMDLCTGENNSWWLRSPGDYGDYAANVSNIGYVYRYGSDVINIINAVCPALHLNLSSSDVWSVAENVTIGNYVEPTKEPEPTVTSEPTKEPEPTVTPSPTLAPGESYGELNSPIVDEEGNVTYSCVYFGNYPQSDAKGETKEPIKWRVLYIQGDDAFLVADQNLDVRRYTGSDRDVTWETCAMRSWLNGYGSELNSDGIDYGSNNFIDRAFNDAEKSAILTTNVVNKDNPEYATLGGNDTQDKIFLLSIDEVSDSAYGFKPYKDDEQRNVEDEARKRIITAYAAGKLLDFCAGKNYNWWLRSPGSSSCGAADVNSDGIVYRSGCIVYDIPSAVCPALHLNLSFSDVWSVAESVIIGNYVEPTKEPEPTVTPKPTATPEPTKEPEPTATPSPTPTLAPGESYGELNSPIVDEEGNVTYSCVYFGNYPQSDATGETKDPIKWRVLYIQGEDAFLVADQNLDVMQYNKSNSDVTWETCTMRSWLNGYRSELNADGIDYGSDNFIDRAFNDAEKSAILTTNVVNKDNPEYGTSGGKDTQDKIFLLSIDEVNDGTYGFKPYKDDAQGNVYDEARKRTDTAYVAEKRGSEIGETDWWWLRSPGYDGSSAAGVDDNGNVLRDGGNVGYDDDAVCPALHLNLSSSDVWSVAESVTVKR